jgi:hypothetical protein
MHDESGADGGEHPIPILRRCDVGDHELCGGVEKGWTFCRRMHLRMHVVHDDPSVGGRCESL